MVSLGESTVLENWLLLVLVCLGTKLEIFEDADILQCTFSEAICKVKPPGPYSECPPKTSVVPVRTAAVSFLNFDETDN